MVPAKPHRRLVHPDELPSPRLRAVLEVALWLTLLTLVGYGLVVAVAR